MTAFRRHRRSSRCLAVWIGVIACAGVPRAVSAINPSDWKHRQTFEISEPGISKISLPAETLDAARPGLVDLRLTGPTGQEVPYVIQIPTTPDKIRQAPQSFHVRIDKLTTEIVIKTGTSTPIETLELVTPAADFLKAARVETSVDGEKWTLVGDGLQLARQPGVESTALPLNKISAPYVRVTVDDWRTRAVAFTGANLILAAAGADETTPVEVDLVKRDEFVHETVLTLDLHARQLPLAFLEFSVTDPFFARAVRVTQRELMNGESIERNLASGTLFRSQVQQHQLRENLRIPLNLFATARELQVHVINDNNAPLAIERVTARRRPVWLIFRAAERGTYGLLTGNFQAEKPVYDLASFAAELGNVPENSAAITKIEANPGYQKVDPLAQTPLLGSALDVAHWKFSKNVTPAASGAQELELDPEVLAHAQRSFGDLRLLQDGRQAPYLLERSALLRSLVLPLTSADDPKQPRLSQWKLKLPLAAIPLNRVTLRSSTALFSRRIAIFEYATDGRGENFRRTLSEPVAWNSTPEKPNPTTTIALFSAPVSDTLFVDTDNGDNPPIALESAQADYPVVRLLFRAGVQPLQLYYGNDAVGAPRYDLELVAQQLFNDEKNSARLGAEEFANGSGVRTMLTGARGGVLLWSALGLVVIVLLAVIARLLPKPQAQK